MNQTCFYSDDVLSGRRTIVIVEDGVMRWTTEENPDYLAWLAEGNTPEPWEAD